MTTIVWDGKVLAADRQLTVGSGKTICKKITSVRRGSVFLAMCGLASEHESVVQWVLEGCNPKEVPELEGSNGLLLMRSGLFLVESGGISEVDMDSPVAIGSGGAFARAAVGLGKNAMEAVRVASEHDVYTGGGVDCVVWDAKAKRGKLAYNVA